MVSRRLVRGGLGGCSPGRGSCWLFCPSSRGALMVLCVVIEACSVKYRNRRYCRHAPSGGILSLPFASLRSRVCAGRLPEDCGLQRRLQAPPEAVMICHWYHEKMRYLSKSLAASVNLASREVLALAQQVLLVAWKADSALKCPLLLLVSPM